MSVHPGSEWIDRNWEELRSYNNEWIAATQNGVVAHDGSFDRVVEEMLAQGVYLEVVVFAYVTFEVVQ